MTYILVGNRNRTIKKKKMVEKLIELRKITGLSQIDFAKKVGCKTQHISQMELGKSAVTIKTIIKFAEKLNIKYEIDVRFIFVLKKIMAQKAYINNIILIWARESANLHVETVAKKISCKIETLENWEQGIDFPTINQAEKLAKIYNRPLAVFYLPQPPKDFQTLRDFRRQDAKNKYFES